MFPALKSTAAAAILALAAGSGHAVYIVDTGPADPNGTQWSLNFGQALGATFTVGAATTITAVEGWIRTLSPGVVQIDLHAAGQPGMNPVQTTLLAIGAPSAPSWQVASGLSWAVVPGTYTVTFTSDGNFVGTMPGNAANPLATEWFTSAGNWVQFDGLELGVRVAAVPEPATWAFMALGLAGIGALSARRRTSRP
jgi:hypothetical protein